MGQSGIANPTRSALGRTATRRGKAPGRADQEAAGLRALSRAGTRCAAARDATEAAAALVECALDLGAVAAAVWRADPEVTGGVTLLHSGSRTAASPEPTLTRPGDRLNSGLLGVLRTGRPVQLDPAAPNPRPQRPDGRTVIDLVSDPGDQHPEPPGPELPGTQPGPVLLVPLRGHRTTVGVLAVARAGEAGAWTPPETELLTLAGRQVTLALARIDSARGHDLAHAAARAEQARSADLLEAMDARAALVTRDGVVLAANSRWRAAVADRSGVRAHVVPPGTNWLDMLRNSRAGTVRTFADEVRRVLDGTREAARFEERHDDSVTEVVALPPASGGTADQVAQVTAEGVAVVLQTDASWRRRLEDELTHRALHDELTGLPNRAALLEGLEASLDRLGEGDMLAVLFCDLDGFKDINDGLGHAVGDQVLVAVARRLRQRCRSADIVARFGGDEFVIVLPVPDVGRAMALADRLVDVLADPIVVDDAEVAPGASIGITVVDRRPEGKDPVGTLLRDADTAMYHAKQRGRGRFEFFDASLQVDIAARLELASALRRADLDSEFSLSYQARRLCGSRALAGVEALARWRTPEQVAVGPSDFVPVAERTGRIVQIGQWVLDRALREVAALDRRTASGPSGFGVTPTIAVNVSPRQLGAPGFVPAVDRAIDEAGVRPEHVLLEITESALVDDPQAARSVLTQLRKLGVQIALDDFGTGWSSLSYLRDLPVDVIKIDRSFVADLPDDPDACAVVAGVLGLGHGMGLVVVAEGVERTDQLEVLRDMGCDEYQGFIDGEPGPLADVLPTV